MAVDDFDGDGRPDGVVSTADGVLVTYLNQTPEAISEDRNHNGIPDECELMVERREGTHWLSWTSGVLEAADSPRGPWTSTPAQSPWSVDLNGTRRFFRVRSD